MENTAKSFSARKWPKVLLVLLLVFGALQFIRPQLDNPPVTADLQAPEEIKQIFRDACYDCHSNQTKLAWFDKITPANWLVSGHVKEGRSVLNFSHWDSLTKAQQKGKLFESLYFMEQDAMPLSQYTMLHRAAVINDRQIAMLKNYLTSISPPPVPDPAKEKTSEEQYQKWLQGGDHGDKINLQQGSANPDLRHIKRSLNGIDFLPGYNNWTAISTTERFDNGTLRVIMGNDIAVKAIKNQQINPWPDGTEFAKIAWSQSIDSSGNIQAGEFLQVEFMIKDKARYAGTEGWGFARWVKGLELVPYGKTALFTTECVNCHQPMKENDFVFTMPLDLSGKVNLPASSRLSPPVNPLEGKVINTIVNKRDQTMSTLYGNEVAVSAARAGTTVAYPPGSVLSLVTWLQKADKHYFGANIPAVIQSIEVINFTQVPSTPASSSITSGPVVPLYQRYEGNPLKETPVAELNAEIRENRIRYIVRQKAAVMP